MKILLLRSLYVIGGLIVVLGLFHLEENWRGRRVWAAWQRSQTRAGKAFDLAKFIPPPVPDADNFALVPPVADALQGRRPLAPSLGVWPNELSSSALGWRLGWRAGKPVDLDAYNRLLSGRGGVQGVLDARRAEMDAFVQATRKPGCRIRMEYARFPEIQIPAFLGFRDMARTLSLRALTELREGKHDAAFEDVSALFRTIHQLEKEPILLAQLLRLALTNIALQPTWEGLQAHAWSQDQLLALQHQLAGTDLLGAYARTWRFEQGMEEADNVQVAQERPWAWTFYPASYSDAGKPGRVASLFRHLLIPRGWILLDGVSTSQSLSRVVLAALDPSGHRVDPHVQEEGLQAAGSGFHMPYGSHTSQLFRLFAVQNVRMANDQASLDEAGVACELERYRLEKGAFPERLSDLTIPLPADIIGGQPLRYRRTADGGYVLYSLGWNAKDDGGTPGQGPDPWTQGDWVWKIAGNQK